MQPCPACHPGSPRSRAGIANGVTSQDLPDLPIPPGCLTGYAGDKPVLFGHYWESGTPRVQSPLAACVDYSACKGGPMVAYHWQGEAELRDEHFVQTAAEPA